MADTTNDWTLRLGLGRVDIASGTMWGTVSRDAVDQLWVSTDGSQKWRTVIG